MQALYSCIKELPSNILFHKGQNLQVDGFRWAPKSLLSEFKSEVGLGVSINPVATIGDKGLHVRFPGFILADLRRPRELGNGFYFRKASDSEETWQRRQAFDETILQTERPAIIFNPTNNQEAVVVAITKEEETLYCRYVSRALLFDESPSELEEAKKNHSLIAAHEVLSDQQWCVG
ncbi:hypothetical protein MMC14_001265 [Varicellaria rhodocarpa]|nr:hypothetical protein [Varicellaria rhodocarpa]